MTDTDNQPIERQPAGDLVGAHIRLPAELLAWFTEYAAQKRSTRGLIIRQALEQYRERAEHE